MLTREEILKACPTPEDALQAMIDGLSAPKPENFRIAMWTFGEIYLDKCAGCAATYTAAQIIGFDNLINSPQLQRQLFSISPTSENSDFGDFELAIDSARQGCLSHLYEWYGEDQCFYNFLTDKNGELPDEFSMSTNDWEAKLSLWQALVTLLREYRILTSR